MWLSLGMRTPNPTASWHSTQRIGSLFSIQAVTYHKSRFSNRIWTLVKPFPTRSCFSNKGPSHYKHFLSGCSPRYLLSVVEFFPRFTAFSRRIKFNEPSQVVPRQCLLASHNEASQVVSKYHADQTRSMMNRSPADTESNH